MNSEESAFKQSDITAQKVGELVDENKYFYNEDESIPAIESLFGSHIGDHVLEIGSGTGAIAHWLVQRGASVTAVEPEPVLAKKISPRFSSADDIEVIIGGSVDAYQQLAERKKVFDTVIYLNVMEHIADDLGEFNKAKAVLKPGGKLLVYVPALPWLYSQIDAETGHVRRYTKKLLREVTAKSGFKLVSLDYFEVVGIIPYLIVYKLLRRRVVTGSSSGFYNKAILPLSLILHKIMRGRLVGKNLVLVASKPQ